MFCGADTEGLRNHADAMEAAEGRCSALLMEIMSAVQTAAWVGADADEFRDSFTMSVTQLWNPTIDRLSASAQELLDHAEEQDAASEGGERQAWGPGGDRVRRGGSGPLVPGSAATNLFGRDGDDESPPLNPDGTVNGPAPFEGHGLGRGVPGTTADAPEPPAWSPKDEGSGEWDTQEPTDEDRETMDLIEKLIFGGRVVGNGAASDNLQHYIDNTGEDKDIDVDDMMSSVPSFGTAVSESQQAIGQEAIDQAQASGATGPVTFPVNTDWTGGKADKSVSEKYFYATGSFDYNLNGTVTAYPPGTPGGEWTYEMSTNVNVRDRYNWDVGKGVTVDVPDWVPGMPDVVSIPDEQMGSLHKAGMAREYNIVGESDSVTSTGP
ncbi:WXG100 family type VII secretion target [uncultured Brachybacterium sp.]|uniref:WXG100 family type VII secretion target n=1 Tax=uncultured Brachybacterium sp. TaxID=189680 RepID=UPI002615BC3E|nr:hypothetical protein [uncultured Brachybacterium sp.]